MGRSKPVSIVNFKRRDETGKEQVKTGWNLRLGLFFVGCALQAEHIFRFLSSSHVGPFFLCSLGFLLILFGSLFSKIDIFLYQKV